MHPFRRFSVTAPLVLILVAIALPDAAGSQVTYTVTGKVSGWLDGTRFTSEYLTVTTVTNTSNIEYDPLADSGPAYQVRGSAPTFQLGAWGGTFIGGDYGVFSQNWSSIPGVLDYGLGICSFPGGGQIDAIFASQFHTGSSLYDLATSFAVINTGGLITLSELNTTAGKLLLNGMENHFSFTAVVVAEIDAAGVFSVIACVGSVLGLLERRRR